MSTGKRALLYIKRKPVRTAILFLLLSAMGLLVLAGASIYKSASASAQEIRRTVTSGFDLTFIPEFYNGDIIETYTNEQGELVRVVNADVLVQDEVEQILSIDGVKGCYSFVGDMSMYTELTVTPGLFSNYISELEEKIAGDPDTAFLYEEELENAKVNAHTFCLLSAVGTEWQPYFINGAIELVQGRHLTADDENKAIVSAEFARQNGLSLGDMVTYSNFDAVLGEPYGNTYTLEIIGIFQPAFEQEISYDLAEYEILNNLIFTGPEADTYERREYANFYGGQPVVNETPHYTGITFYVDDPIKLDDIIEQVRSMDIVDWNYYTIEKNDADYRNVAGPLQSVLNLSMLLLVITVLGCFFVLALLLNLWTRGRRAEIGTLLSVGTGKRQIILQLLLESLAVTAAAFLTAALLAGPVSEAIGNAMTTVTAPSADAQPYSASVITGTFRLEIIKTATEAASLNLTITAAMLLAIFAAMAAITVVSVLASSYTILRQRPRELLLRR